MTLRVWIGCLADYNAGRLIGDWFDISTDPDENAANVRAVLAKSKEPNAEEAFCADYEAPRVLSQLLGEYPGAATLAHAARLWEAVSERFPDDDEAAAVIDQMTDGYQSPDLESFADNAEDWISERFAGEGDTIADWCESFLEDTGELTEVPERWRPYIDVESYARDLELGGDISTTRVGGKVLVFWNR